MRRRASNVCANAWAWVLWARGKLHKRPQLLHTFYNGYDASMSHGTHARDGSHSVGCGVSVWAEFVMMTMDDVRRKRPRRRVMHSSAWNALWTLCTGHACNVVVVAVNIISSSTSLPAPPNARFLVCNGIGRLLSLCVWYACHHNWIGIDCSVHHCSTNGIVTLRCKFLPHHFHCRRTMFVTFLPTMRKCHEHVNTCEMMIFVDGIKTVKKMHAHNITLFCQVECHVHISSHSVPCSFRTFHVHVLVVMCWRVDRRRLQVHDIGH